MDEVAAALTEVAQDAILPVYQRIEADPLEVTPGEWVTTADLAAEAALLRRLQSLLPDAACVAEEASKDDPRILERLETTGRAWLVDPLDGTSNFAQGKEPFRSMIALVEDGQTVASWIHDPISGSMAIAERGSGAWFDGERVRAPIHVPATEQIRGSILRRFLPKAVLAQVNASEQQLGAEIPASKCAGYDYVGLARGDLDYVLYWRTLPWDHIPGALFLTEAGGVVNRPNGDEYQARTHGLQGLLAAPNPELWGTVHDILLPTSS